MAIFDELYDEMAQTIDDKMDDHKWTDKVSNK